MAPKKSIKNLLEGIDELSEIPEIPATADKAENFEEVLEDIQETSEELTADIKKHFETKKPKGKAGKIKKTKPDQYLLDLKIPFCSKCFEPFSVNLAGEIQCFHKLEPKDCPALKK